jgi:hypothetical protein
MEPISIKIDVTKLDKTAFYKGEKGTYCTLVVWPNRDGEDRYGNYAGVRQDLGKDRREEKAAFIGDARIIKRKNAPQSKPPANYEKLPTTAEMAADDDIPF